MKQNILFLAFFILTGFSAYCQSSILLGGGWASANPDDLDESTSGFRINGQYEYKVGHKPWATGLAISYMEFSGEISPTNLSVKYHSIPINFYGKYVIGQEKIKGALKGIIGMQTSSRKLETANGGSTTGKDFGLDLGFGAGITYDVSESFYLGLDYEFLYITNGFFDDGIVNSISLGAGFRF
jgi:hypothetical protein